MLVEFTFYEDYQYILILFIDRIMFLSTRWQILYDLCFANFGFLTNLHVLFPNFSCLAVSVPQ